MRSDLREKYYGTPLDEWISKVTAELAVDAVGLWQIVSFGRDGFGLSGDELVEYVRRNLLALFENGAKPVIGATNNVHYWTRVDYGDTNEEMADAVIGEWRATGEDPDAGGVWFALPHVYERVRPPGDEPRLRKGDLS